jgi:hypothetical protein
VNSENESSAGNGTAGKTPADSTANNYFLKIPSPHFEFSYLRVQNFNTSMDAPATGGLVGRLQITPEHGGSGRPTS